MNMLTNISWIFFDIGSTLVDESKVYERRICEAIEGSGVTYAQFCDVMIGFYKQNKKGDLEAIKLFGLKKTRWHSEDEMVYPQAKDCLTRLREKYKIGIIANQPMGTARRMKSMGLIDYIDLVISSDEEKMEKPDLSIFRLALERAGCSADNAVMVGDRLDNDIAPAKRMGLKTIWLKQGFGGLSTPMSEGEIPDFIANDLDEVRGLFVL